jgi:hypothetical protein
MVYHLGGTTGGHAKHLVRHKLRLRTQHGTVTDTYQNVGNASEGSYEEEFLQAQDHYQPEFTISDKDNSDTLHVDNEQQGSDDEDDSHIDPIAID